MVVGILNSYDRFGAFAISPLFWNIAIIAVLVGLAPAFPEGDEIYAYAVGDPRRHRRPARDPRLRPAQHAVPAASRLRLALEGGSPGPAADAAGDDQPRADQLQLLDQQLLRHADRRPDRRPAAPRRRSTRRSASTCSRRGSSRSPSRRSSSRPSPASRLAGSSRTCVRTMSNGMRQIVLLLVPAAAAILVLSEPMIRLIYERGEFDASQTELVATALFWFAFSLPFNGLFLLLTRTFFSLQRPWLPTGISLAQPARYGGRRPRALPRVRGRGHRRRDGDRDRGERRRRGDRPARQLGGLDLRRFGSTTSRVAIASAMLAGVCLRGLVGARRVRSAAASAASSSRWAVALAAGGAVYAAAVYAMRVPEARQIMRLMPGRSRAANEEE